MKQIIVRVDENDKELEFRDLVEAAKSINSKFEDWKIQLLIADAINHNKTAFKYRWKRKEK